ncbi:MAG: NgoPII family restriction endonuclease [Saprospiraceae bacterium]
MTNILNAIYNISKLNNLEVEEIKGGGNRMVNLGEGLEIFVKNAFAGTYEDLDKKAKIAKFSDVFSYEGSKRTPPDLMLKGGDAIEVKKVETLTSELQLNSSYPKNKLFSDSKLINNHCRTCEDWREKDIIYTIGHVLKKSKKLSSIWFVYGSLYAADPSTYTSLKHTLTESLENTNNINFSPTNEIGRVNYVDPLRITNLRIRGMWLLKPPFKAFDYVHRYSKEANFQYIAIIPKSKYYSFDEASRNQIEQLETIKIYDDKVQNPNNPAHLIDCKIIRYQR